jgi:hypothetical protein
MSIRIRIRDEEAGVMDNQFVAEYDPTRLGTAPDGREMIAHLVVTDDPEKALQFPTFHAAMEKWREAHGMRADGRMNRPLTAFCVEFSSEEEA